MNVATIKKDLRQLKKTIHIIEAQREARERYEKRIEALSRLAPTEKIKEQIETTKKIISLMDVDRYIDEASQLEEKYINAINTLSPIDKTIITESFLNGKPYWKIGLSLGYSEEGIRKKIDKILRQLLQFFS